MWPVAYAQASCSAYEVTTWKPEKRGCRPVSHSSCLGEVRTQPEELFGGLFSGGSGGDSCSHADHRSEEVQRCPESARLLASYKYTGELQLIGFTSPCTYAKAITLTLCDYDVGKKFAKVRRTCVCFYIILFTSSRILTMCLKPSTRNKPWSHISSLLSCKTMIMHVCTLMSTWGHAEWQSSHLPLPLWDFASSLGFWICIQASILQFLPSVCLVIQHFMLIFASVPAVEVTSVTRTRTLRKLRCAYGAQMLSQRSCKL